MKVEFNKNAIKNFKNLSNDIQKNIWESIDKKLLVNPELYLLQLKWTLKKYYKFRVWDYRLICKKEYDRMVILVVKIWHRKEVYK